MCDSRKFLSDLDKKLWTAADKLTRKFEWQSGYAAFSVSESQMPVVAEYIAKQAVHHRKSTFEEEFLAILKKHNIEFDMRHVFEQEVIA